MEIVLCGNVNIAIKNLTLQEQQKRQITLDGVLIIQNIQNLIILRSLKECEEFIL